MFLMSKHAKYRVVAMAQMTHMIPSWRNSTLNDVNDVS